MAFTALVGCTSKGQTLRLKAGQENTIKIKLQEGWKINGSAPSQLGLYYQKGLEVPLQSFSLDQLKSQRDLKLTALQPHYRYRLKGTLYICEARDAAGSKNSKDSMSFQAGSRSEDSVCVKKAYERKIEARDSEPTSEVVIELSMNR